MDVVLESARETLDDMEYDAMTRVNVARNVMHLARTSNVVGATWLHTTARPIDGYPDMNLHVHAWVANATHTGERWTALDMSAMVRDSQYYESMFQARLASKLQSLGFAVERSEHNFELKGVSRSLIKKFSRRTQEIEDLAEELGIDHPAFKGKLGATTRQKKSKSVDPASLPALWKDLLSPEEARELADVVAKPYSCEPVMNAKQAVDHACEHLFERQSVIRERQLVAQALFYGIGNVSVDDVRREIASREWIREGADETSMLSTAAILREEQKLLVFARGGRGAASPLAPDHTISRNWLSNEQAQAVQGILGSTDRVQILRGVAGSGKTTLMQEAVEGIESSGTRVIALAPTAEAAEVLKHEGFDANTLASFLVDKQRQAEAKSAVLWIDEAGLIGTPTLARLVDVAKDLNARLVLAGDKQQHTPVERGHALRLLEEQAGIRPHEVTEIRRQRGAYKEAVSHLSRGEVQEGFAQLEALGFVHELSDADRYQQLARDYADAKEAGKSTLVIAPTHAERDIITQTIREEMKSRGRIKSKEHEFTTLKSLRLTAAERADPFNYAAGDVIEFTARGKGGFKPGDRLEIIAIEAGQVLAQGKCGSVKVPLESAGAFDVFRPETTRFAAGDIVRITRNSRATKDHKRLTNGSLYELQGFTRNGQLKLKKGPTLDPEWGHIEHGISVTSFASQGKTVQRVFLAQSNRKRPVNWG